jgi:hypothetical protein
MERRMTRLTRRILPVALLAISPLLAGHALADALRADGFRYSDGVTVIGLKDGQLYATINGSDKLFALDKVESIELTGQPQFNEAETSRKDAKKSAALYKEAMTHINDRKLKVLAAARAIGPADSDGKFLEAVGYFLEVYSAFPTDDIWKLKPANIPPATSSMLKESADRIRARVSLIKSDDAKKNLKTFELELLTKANDPRAGALAKELGTGTVESPTNTVQTNAEPAPAANISGGESTEGVSNAIRAKNYDAAIAQADTLLKTANEANAVALLELKAQAYEAQKKLDLAAAALIRVSAHYPNNSKAIPDLMRAAELQKTLKHDDEAKRLSDEITAMRNRPRN